MSNYYLHQEPERCIGCYSCEAHCKAYHDLPPGPRLSQIIPVGPKRVNGLPRMAYVFIPCFHCELPWCVSACPTGAMQKRNEDGIVFVDSDLCVGCKTCITACPWGTPQWNPVTGKVVKCDFCKDRLDEGLKPACVTKCVTQCLYFGGVEQANKMRRERHARKVASLE